MAEMQRQMAQQNMMMQQMMMNMLNQNQNPGQAPAAQSAAPANPTTKAEIQALLDSLDAKLVAGEISEAAYNKLVEKWQQRLSELGS
jgi:hypothetical protein